MNNRARQVKRILLALLAAASLSGVAFAQEVVTYYHTDLAGSPIAASDASGNVVWREDFSPYGEKLVQQSGAVENHMWFTGHHHDDASGLTYAGARHYDPMIGRFMGVDPAEADPGDQFSFNRYAYGNNNPYRYVDPDGRSAISKAVKFALKGGDLTATFADTAQDLAIVANPAASPLQRVIAGVSIASELSPVSLGDAKDIVRVAEKIIDRGRAAKEGKTLYHYTDGAGAMGITESGVIRANEKGRVFVTDQKLSPDEVKDRLFIGRSGDKGSHVVVIDAAKGLPIRQGKNANEMIHQGSIRDGRQGTLTVKPNDF